MWLGKAQSYVQSVETHWAYVPAAVASSRMGDHPGFITPYPCHTYQNACYNPINLKTYKQIYKNNPHLTIPYSMANVATGSP